MQVEVIDTDNRDPITTVLTLSNGTKVEINPVELFHNMLENHPGWDKIQQSWEDLKTLIDRGADE